MATSSPKRRLDRQKILNRLESVSTDPELIPVYTFISEGLHRVTTQARLVSFLGKALEMYFSGKQLRVLSKNIPLWKNALLGKQEPSAPETAQKQKHA